MKEELKPCAHCASKKISLDGEAWRCHRFECDDCGVGGPYSDMIAHNDGLIDWEGVTNEEAIKQAADRWNQRVIIDE